MIWQVLWIFVLGTGEHLNLPPLPNPLTPTITLSWNPSPSPDVTGYKVYQGLDAGTYTSSIDVGNVTNVTIPMPTGTNYFAATAYSGTGIESDFSNEAVFAPGQPIPVYGLLFNQGSTNGVTWVDLTPTPFLRLTNAQGGPFPWQWFRSRTMITTNWQ